jgi:hypothetical protein
LAAVGFVDVAAQDPELSILVELSGSDLFAQNTSQPPLTLTGGRVLAGGGRDRPRVERVDLRYVSRPTIPGITANTVDSVRVTATANEDLLIPVPLFGREMTRRLNELPPDNAASYDVTVNFEFVGTMVLSGAPIRTESTPFSFRVVKSEVTCAGTDTRLARFATGTPLQIQACSYFGVEQRFTANQCCSNGVNAGQPGCEPLP